MLFKNAVIYSFTMNSLEVVGLGDTFTEKLKEDLFKPVGPQEVSRSGWVSAIPGVDDWVFGSNGCLFFRLRTDTKVLKSSAINREVNELAAAIERDQGRKVRKAEKEELREQVRQKYLPNAQIDSTYTVGYIDLKKDWLVIEASSFKAAEDFTSRLRKTLGSLPVRPVALEMGPGWVMTTALDPTSDTWEGDALLKHFSLGEECTMVGVDGEKASFRDMDLISEEVTHHITESGMMVNSLRLSREDQLAFTLTDDFRVKKIKFLDTFQEDVLNYEPEDEDIDAGLSYTQATLFLMTGQFRTLFEALIESMGGIEEDFSVDL
ncbi:recombination-associated protein RdgC [Marinobacter nauticus]|uniref:recombination-associated protein RdgC n=1 Tax=Marinobacter nauticus TaxID=2743 RepID=UPI00373591D2